MRTRKAPKAKAKATLRADNQDAGGAASCVFTRINPS